MFGSKRIAIDILFIERYGKSFNQFLMDKQGFAGRVLRFLVCRNKREARVSPSEDTRKSSEFIT